MRSARAACLLILLVAAPGCGKAARLSPAEVSSRVADVEAECAKPLPQQSLTRVDSDLNRLLRDYQDNRRPELLALLRRAQRSLTRPRREPSGARIRCSPPLAVKVQEVVTGKRRV